MKPIFSILSLLLFLPILHLQAQTSLTGGGLTQNFDGMAATTTLPTNWRFHRSATPTWAAGTGTVGQQASSGSPTTGSGYNWGSTAAERAIGVMSSGGYPSPSSFMWSLTNGTGATISQMALSYDVERYRINTAAASVQFFYSTDGSAWTAVTAGDVAAGSLPTGASAYGFNPPNLTVNVGVFYITGLSITNGSSFYLRWNLNTTGANSQGIGIDNVVLSNTTPQTLPYSQNFGTSTFTSFPNGFWGFRNINGSTVALQANAEATNPNMLATVTAQSGAFGSEPAGGLFGQVISSDANLVIATSNSTTDGLNQPVTAINTGTATSVDIAYDQIVRYSGNRTMGMALQYRSGTSGAWTTATSSVQAYAASPTLNSVTNKTFTVSGLTASTNYQFRWITWRNHASGSTNTSIGLDNVSFAATPGTPSIAISIVDPGAGSVTQGTTNVVLQQYNLAVTVANASFTGLNVTTAGTYASADITNLKVRYSADATLDVGDATLSTLTTPGTAGSKTFPSFTAQTINSGSTGYIFVTADVAAGATSGNTISIGSNAFTNFSFASGTKTGTDPAAGAGTKTFSSLVPTIAISTSSPAASNHNGGSTNVVLSRIDLGVTVTDATLSGLTVTTAGTYAAADLDNLKVRYSSDATLDGGDATLSTKTTGLGAGTQVFPGFTSQLIASGTTGYIFITADISAASTGGNNINLGSTAFSNISFSSGTKTGTDPVAAGNLRTIINPSIAITSSSPAASAHLQGSTNVVLHRFDLAVTSSNATLSGITVTTAGSYVSADVSNIKVRYSTDATLDGADVTLSTLTTPGVAGVKVFPGFTSQVINSGSTGYVFITADVSASATSGNTISLASTAFSNLSFSFGKKTGTDPVPAGNARTFIKPEPTNATTGFACGTTTTATIPLNWTDATGGTTPDGYLIRWSTTSFVAIPDPTDGTAVANGSTAQNVAQGVLTFTPSGLTSGTTYYFKIFPYTNSGTNIDYKISGIQQTSCATLTGPCLSEGFAGGTTAPSGWVFTGITGTYTTATNYGVSSPSIRFDDTNDRVETPTLSGTATELSFWLKGQGTNATSALLVEGFDGSTWSTVENITNSIPTTGTTKTYNSGSSPALAAGFTKFRFTYTKSVGNLAFDDVLVTCAVSCTAPTTTTAVTPSNTTSGGADIAWTGAAGDGSMVVIRATANANVAPASGTSYTANVAWASAGQINTNNRVVFRALGSSVSGLTGLTAETQYTATVYNYNNTGNCYQLTSPASNTFYTLSNEPAAHAASFTSTPDSPSQITLSFSAASTITNADGYLIFRRASASPTFTPADATAYTVGNTYGDAVLVANISSTATTSFVNNSGLSASTAYYYALVPYNWNGAITATYNYRTAVTIPATNSTTLAPAAEINVQGNGNNIADGDATPSLTDHSDFGGVLVSSGTIVRTFTIQNTGSAGLNLTGAPLVSISGTNAADFSVFLVPVSPVAASGNTTFQITFNPSASGTRTAEISIDNSDSDENPYNFSIQGTGLVPEIQLEQPVATNQACGFNYDFGSKLITTNTDLTIRVRNTGDGSLDISSVAISGLDAAEFSIQNLPSSTIGGASFDDLVIRFSPTTGGSKVAVVTILSSDDDEGSCTINLYGEGDATPVLPTLISPTVSTVTNNTATLGATISFDGNASISARGTVWKTSAGVTAGDSPLAEGGTAVEAFTQSRSGLPSGTRIYYRGYATNSAGTGLSPESDFYTLSNEPVAGPASFTATSISATQINLSFSAASSIPASGYVILIKAGSAVIGTPSDATAYALNDVVGDANVVALITTATTFSVTGLSASTNYHFAIFPYSWNGVNNQTRNYRTTSPLAASATTGAATLPVLGDIAFVAYATDAPDRFAFVALADIAANAEIAFTDNAWSSSSALCTNEETVRWKAPSAGLPKGTVVRIQGITANVGSIVSGNLNNLSATADQIFAYTGTSGSPTFIAGLSTTTFAGACQICGASTNASCIASGLTNGTNAISFATHSDNGYYNGETYGTAATLRAEINNPANWVRSNTTQTWPTPWSFTIGNVTITTGTITGSPFCITNSTGIAVSVPFTTGGTFESGNVFTAQLSDATGSFAIPTDIGTGTVSPISANIPAGKPTGTGYRIRVVSSDPEANGLQNTSNLTIYLNTPDVTGVSALRQNGGAILSWTNPGGCWDQVLVVTQPTNAITAIPTGDGTAYTANSTFLSGTAFGTGGSVVFKGTTNNVTITGYTNSTTYFVKVFVRRGTVWSDGVEVSVVPSPDITGDFRSRVATGNWTNFNTWERYNGTAWVNAITGQFPDNTTTTVTIQNGHTITVDASSDPYDVKNIIVASGGKLYANYTGGNRYLSVYGDITCNGTIGNGSSFDGISFNFQGTKCTVSGTGIFDCSRFRKNDVGPTGTTTDLIVAMNVNVRWNSASGTAIYNNDSRSPGSRFNVTVNENSILSCIPTSGSNSGNASIDGVDGGNSAASRAAGTFTINGTMNIPGTLFATTDNDATGGYFCRWVIGSTGVINCRQLDCSASGAAGHTIQIKQGGKLNINNNNDNTINPVVNFSTTNNNFTFETGSVIEYSSTDLVGTQKIFINAGFPYQNLLLSGPSTKQLQSAGTLSLLGNLTITAGVLDIQTNNIDLKGNWQSYSQAAFTEGSQKVTFSGTGLQTVTCEGGEQFFNVDITNSSPAGVRLDADVTLANDLDLGTNGRLSFGPTPTRLTLSKMTASANTFKGSGTANVDLSGAEHVFVIGCPDPGYTGTLNAGTTSTIIYNRDEDFAGSNDDQNILTGFSYANILLTGKGNKVISNNLTVNGSFTAETPDLIISVPVANRTLTLGGDFTLNSGATMNDNCRDNQEIITTGNAAQTFNTNTKNLKAFNLKSTKSAGGISLTGGAADQTTVNLKNDFALDYTGTAVFTDNANTINIGDDAELGSGTSTISNFAFTGLMQFNGIGAATDIHLSDFAGTGRARAELNHVIIRAGENATTDQLEVYPTGGGQSVTVKGNLEIIQGANSSEFDLNGNTLNLKGNWTSYDENAFNEGTTSTVIFNGTAAQSITCPTKEKFANLTWDNPNDLTLTQDLDIVSNLTVSEAYILTGSFDITLSSTATINETEFNYVKGEVKTTRTLNLTNHTFGGLGLEIDADGVSPGVTDVTRFTNTPVSGAGNQGILRKFRIVPATNSGLNAKLVFHYFDDDINGLDENSFQLYRSTDGGIHWTEQESTADALANQVERTGIDAFSDWTLGDVNTPLKVVWLGFWGRSESHTAILNWKTVSSWSEMGFKVQRSRDGQNFEDIGFVPVSGRPDTEADYQFEDPDFNQDFYYRLVSVDATGRQESGKTILLNCGCAPRSGILLMPNPASGPVHLDILPAPGADEVFELEIQTIDGRRVYQNHGPFSGMDRLLNAGLSPLPDGLYQIRVFNPRISQIIRFRKN